MTNSEVNKIIAEFMGWKEWRDKERFMYPTWYAIFIDKDGARRINPFTKSLDALVPVWEKMIGKNCYGMFSNIMSGLHKLGIRPEINVQQAAAHATAKAILELKESDV